MKVLILGAGITGVTLAYFLAERGHEVEVVERQPGSAMETSFANGGQLSYCHAEPWANPHVLPKVVKWLGKKDAPLVFRLPTDIHTLRWSLQFFMNCFGKSYLKRTETTLRLALYSRSILNELEKETDIQFHHWHKGILHVFKTEEALQGAISMAKFQAELGAPFERLTKEECIKKEPALSYSPSPIAGGIYYAKDESGDIFIFTKSLADKGEKTGKGITFHYSTVVNRLIAEGDSITGVETSKGRMSADMVVMAMGSYSYVHLKRVGVHVPIYPMKGYSISIPAEHAKGAPTVSITDQAEKIVYSRLGDIVRVAGTAEFAGYDHTIQPHRIAGIKRAVKGLFPECGDIDNAAEWACLRPSTPDGPPILGKTKYKNLVLNTGHGTLGWTLAPGSAKIVADLIEHKTPEIDLSGLTLDRF